MSTATKDPILSKWTSSEPSEYATAYQAVDRLAEFEVHQIPDYITPFLAAASAEVASIAGIRWQFSPDDTVVVLLRIIARGAIAKPNARGPHTQRLFERIVELGRPGQTVQNQDLG